MAVDPDTAVIAGVIVVVMFVSMRLLYGYWPWQLHPSTRKLARPVHEEQRAKEAWVPMVGQDVVLGAIAKKTAEKTYPEVPMDQKHIDQIEGTIKRIEDDHYDRHYTNEDVEAGSQRDQQEDVAHPQADDEGERDADSPRTEMGKPTAD